MKAALHSASKAIRQPTHLLPLAFSLLLLSGALLVATTARGTSTPALIGGDSMAPALLGLHYEISCRHCGFPVKCGLQHPPYRNLAFCPNCGFRENRVENSHRRPSAVVSIVPLGLAGEIERGDVIAFLSPTDGSHTVKRVLALPGEQPSIDRGDVYVASHPVQKSLSQLREVAVLVHDNAYRPLSNIEAPGWRADPPSSLTYQANGTAKLIGTMQFDPSSISAVAIPADTPQTTPRSFVDLDAYNQSLSRPLHAVRDLLLEGEFRLPPSAKGSFRLAAGEQWLLRLEIEAEGATLEWTSVNGLQRVALPWKPNKSWHSFALAWCDGRLLASLDGQRFAHPLPANSVPNEPLRWSIRSIEMELRNLQISRDLYYLHPRLTNHLWTLPTPLAADEYFVLGDNYPASTDSRHWQQGIHRANILGKVLIPK